MIVSNDMNNVTGPFCTQAAKLVTLSVCQMFVLELVCTSVSMIREPQNFFIVSYYPKTAKRFCVRENVVKVNMILNNKVVDVNTGQYRQLLLISAIMTTELLSPRPETR